MTTGKKIALSLIALIGLGGGGFLLYNKFGKKQNTEQEALMESTTVTDGQKGGQDSSTNPQESENNTIVSTKSRINQILESDVVVKSSPLPLKSGSIGRLVLIVQYALRKLGAVTLNMSGVLDIRTIAVYMKEFYSTTGTYKNNIAAIEKNKKEIDNIDVQIAKIKEQISKSPKTSSLYTKTLSDLAAKRNSLNKIDADLKAKNSFKEISSSDYAALMNRHGGFNRLFTEAQKDTEFMAKWNKFSNA